MFKHNLNLSLFLFAILNGYATAGKHDFDVLIFTQHWPQTVCYTWKEKDPSHSCALPRDKGEWTIHGIWPSQFNKLGPAFCNPSLPFDPNALAPLAGQLKEKWIDIEYGRESSSLWEHEWNKHGTCAAVLPQLSTEQKYFNEGLVLLSKYDMKNVLARANIVPGFSYRVPDILNGIQQVLGTHATVECRKNRDTGESYLFEIRICFDKTLRLVNCDGVYGYPTNCRGNVKYPGDIPHNYFAVRV